MFFQRPSIVFGRGYCAFGVRVFRVTYEGLLTTDPLWSTRWSRTGKKFESRHLQFARVSTTAAAADYISGSASSSPTFHNSALAKWQAINVREFEFADTPMERPERIWLIALKVHEMKLRAYRNELILAKLNFMLWEWNWICAAMVQKCTDRSAPETDRHQSNLNQWQIIDWKRVLGRYVGEDGNLTFDSESVKVMSPKRRRTQCYSRNHAPARMGTRWQDTMITCKRMWQSRWCRSFDHLEQPTWQLGKLDL